MFIKRLFIIGAFLFLSVAARAETVIIVANPSVNVDSMTAEEANIYFLKKRRTWPNGALVRPIEWAEGQPTRLCFIQQVLKQTERDLVQYWITQKFYTGTRPPIQLTSGQAICQFISTVEGSVGYFLASSSDLKDCAGVKILGQFE